MSDHVLNNQTAFDKVVRHLLKQGKRSESSEAGGCAYRGEMGLACAVGCLIPDDEYRPSLEGESVENIQKKIPSIALLSQMLLMDLQHTHDSHDPADWRTALIADAEMHGLQFPEGV